MNRNLK